MKSLLRSALILFASTLIATVVNAAEPIRVVSFNIRYGTADDKENHWEKRSALLMETIKELKPDLLGTQETLLFQKEFLEQGLEDFDSLGVGRDDGKDRGEMMALFYRRERFERLDAGHFWLSETPDVVGSKSWDSALPRMVTWVKLKDRADESATPILFLNTHFDHQGETARQESAKLLRQKGAELGKDCAFIITGDFNAEEESPAYKNLFASDGTGIQLIDTYRAIHQQRGESEGTFNGFDSKSVAGARIDWIGVSSDWEIIEAEINHRTFNNRTPSDHFPVYATLKRK